MFEDSVSSIPSIWASMNSWFSPFVLFVLLNVMIATIFFTSSLANQHQHHQNQTQDEHPHHQQKQTGLARSPSVLQRLKSINFYGYRSPDSGSHYASEQKTETQKFFQQTLFEQPTNPDSDAHFTPEQTRESRNTETHKSFQQTLFEQAPNPDSDTQFAHEQTHKSLQTETQNFFEKTQFEEEEEESPTLDEIYSQLKDRHVSRTNSDTKPAGGEMPSKLPAKMRKSASAKSAFAHFEENDVVEARRPATVREGNARATDADDDGVDAKADDFINKFKHQLKLQRIDSIIRINRGGGK